MLFGPHTYLGHGSAPTLATHGLTKPPGAASCSWAISGSGAIAGTYYYYQGGAWVPGKTFAAADDGQLIVQSCFGQRVAIHITAGTITGVTGQFHQGTL